MRMSRFHAPTRRQAPRGVERAGDAFLVRAGMLRVDGSERHLLPLGLLARRQIEATLRDALADVGALELSAGGRSPTGMATLLGADLRSYRQLPLVAFEIRDDGRALFTALSEPGDSTNALRSSLTDALAHTLDRCRLRATVGPGDSHQHLAFMVDSPDGPIGTLRCDACGEQAPASSWPAPAPEPALRRPDGLPSPRRVETPGARTVEEVTGVLGVAPRDLIKTLLVAGPDGVHAALVRGDRALSLAKLARALGVQPSALTMASEEQVVALTGAAVGFAGPLGLDAPLVVDLEVADMGQAVCGANETDFHLEGVWPRAHFVATQIADLTLVDADSPCARCGAALKPGRGSVLAELHSLGAARSRSLGCATSTADGAEQLATLTVGHLDLGATLTAIADQHHDDKGLLWPTRVAPFQAVVVGLGRPGDPVMAAAEAMAQALRSRGVRTLLDDTNDRAGVKFGNADLMGSPHQIVVGRRSLERGELEWRDRRSAVARAVPQGDAPQLIADKVAQERQG